MKNKILRLISSVLILLLLCITTTGATYTEADDDKSWHVTEKVYFGDNYTGFKKIGGPCTFKNVLLNEFAT